MKSSPPSGTIVYVGTYTRSEPHTTHGIFTYRLDQATGELYAHGAVSGHLNPSYLAVDPQGRYLFAVQELAEHGGQPGGLVNAFAIDPQTSALTPINGQRTHGADPCYVSTDHSGRWLYVANYTGGSVCVLPIAEDGALGEATAVIQHSGSSVNPRRQEGPHAHSIQPDPANRFVLAADLGLDQILVYGLGASEGMLTPSDAPAATLHPGAGPRHLAFHPNGAVLYCMNELDSTVTVFAYDPERGVLRSLQTVSALPDGFAGSSTGADIHVHPTGRYLYSSNRGHDSIAIFAIDPSGLLTPAGHTPTGGRTPRNFAIEPSGTYLLAANQDSDSIVTFRIDAASGALAPTGHEVAVRAPVCVRFLAGA